MPIAATIASIYVESVEGLIDAKPNALKAADAWATELRFDVVESLLPRAEELLDTLTALADAHELVSDTLAAEQAAAQELADYRKELRALARAERRRAARLAENEDDDGEVLDNEDDDGEILDVDDALDEREQDQLEANLLPAAEEKYAAAKADREAAVAEAQEQLGQVLTALRELDDR